MSARKQDALSMTSHHTSTHTSTPRRSFADVLNAASANVQTECHFDGCTKTPTHHAEAIALDIEWLVCEFHADQADEDPYTGHHFTTSPIYSEDAE